MPPHKLPNGMTMAVLDVGDYTIRRGTGRPSHSARKNELKPMTKKPSKKHARHATAQNSLAPLLYDGTDNAAPEPALQDLPVDTIDEDPANARKSFDRQELETLAASIATNGLIQPIVVRPQDGRYIVTAGHRRLRAVRDILKRPKIRALIEIGRTAAGIRAASAVENAHRADLTPLEEALALQHTIDAGLTIEQAAQAHGVAHTTAKRRLRLLRLPEPIARKVGRDGFSMEHAEVLLPLADNQDMLKVAAEAIGEESVYGNGQFPDADEFTDQVVRKLEAKKLIRAMPQAYEVDQLRAHDKGIKAKLAKVPTLKLDGMSYVTDVKALNDATLEARQSIQAEKEKEAKHRPKYDPGFDRDVRQARDDLVQAAIVKATKGIMDLGGKEVRALLHLATHEAGFNDNLVKFYAEASGFPVDDIRTMFNRGNKDRSKILARVSRMDDQAPLIRLLMAATIKAIVDDYAYGAELAAQSDILEAWTGSRLPDYERQAKAKVRADRKAAKVAAKKATKDGATLEVDPSITAAINAESEDDTDADEDLEDQDGEDQ